MKSSRRRLDGVLLLDKPGGMTSNAALQASKRLFNAAKAGHTGTLDPMATGLLPLCFGEATKFAHMLLDADKSYSAVMQLGAETDTGDAEGVVTGRRPVDVTTERLNAVLTKFRGAIEQVPPMYSALKRNGRPLYELAREGKEVERQARCVIVRHLEARLLDGDRCALEVRSSKGTYIRSLAADIGRELGCGAHLVGLRRTGIDNLCVEDAVTLAGIESAKEGERDAMLLPVDALVRAFEAVQLSDGATQRFICGQVVEHPRGEVSEAIVRVYAECGRFLGLGQIDGRGLLAPKRLISSGTIQEITKSLDHQARN